MALLTVQQTAVNSGATLTANSATATTGDTFVNDGQTYLLVRNGSGSSITVTLTAVATSAQIVGGGSVAFASPTVTVGAGANAVLGPFAPSLFNSSGIMTVICSAVTSVTVSPFKASQL